MFQQKKTVEVGDFYVQKGAVPILWQVVAHVDTQGLPPHVRIAEIQGSRIQAISVSALLENGWFERVSEDERRRLIEQNRTQDFIEPLVGAAE